MKSIVKVLLVIIFMGATPLLAQYNTSYLHSATGKKWIQKVNPDDNNGRPEDKDDSFTFYSDGRVTVDLGANQAVNSGSGMGKPGSGTSNVWKASGSTLQWSVFVNGQERTYTGLIHYLGAEKLIIHLVEPGREDARIVVLEPQS